MRDSVSVRWPEVEVVDEKPRIILDAQAHGTSSEHELPVPVVEALKLQLRDQTSVGADAGHHAEAGLKALASASASAACIKNMSERRRHPPAAQRR